MTEKATRNRGLGPAASRLLRALAEESPRMLTRDELVRSEALSRAHGKHDERPLEENEIAAASKTLSRLISKEDSPPIREVLVLSRDSDDIPTQEVGLIGVSISLTEIRKKKGASQEKVLDSIIQESKQWITRNNSGNFPPIVLNALYIIHGSSEYDIIVFVDYMETEVYMKYVRDVIQSIDGVEKTHTMQVAHGIEGSPMF